MIRILILSALVSAVLPRRVMPKLFLGLAGLALFAPVLLCWGYYATELSWLNVDSVMAVLQTNAGEAMEYVKDRTGAFSGPLALLFAACLAVWVRLASRLTATKHSWKRIAGLVFFLVLNLVHTLIHLRDGHVFSNFLKELGVFFLFWLLYFPLAFGAMYVGGMLVKLP